MWMPQTEPARAELPTEETVRPEVFPEHPIRVEVQVQAIRVPLRTVPILPGTDPVETIMAPMVTETETIPGRDKRIREAEGPLRTVPTLPGTGLPAEAIMAPMVAETETIPGRDKHIKEAVAEGLISVQYVR